MNVIVNGDEKLLGGGLTVAGLVDFLELDPRKVAVELNLAIVSRSAYAATALKDGDRLEIVQFVGGG